MEDCAGAKGTWAGDPIFCFAGGYPIVSVEATDEDASEPGHGSNEGSGEFTIRRDADATTTYDLTVYFEVEAMWPPTSVQFITSDPPEPGVHFDLAGEGVSFDTATGRGSAVIPTNENEVVIEVVPLANYDGGRVYVILSLVDDEDEHDDSPEGKHYDLADTDADDDLAKSDIVFIDLNPPGTFTVDLESSTLPNDATDPVTVTVTRNGGPAGAVDVPITFSGTAEEGVHFTISGLSSNPVSLAASGPTSSTTFQVSATGAAAGDRTLIITAGKADHTEYAVPGITPDSATLDIPDLTDPTIVVSTSSGPLLEGSNAHGTFTLRRPASLSGDPLNVDVAVAGATVGTHFVFVDCSSPGTQISAPTTVTFPEDRSRVNVCIRALDDGSADPRKTVTLSIEEADEAGDQYRVGSPSSASITIIDADLPEVVLRVIDTVARTDESGEEVSVGRFEVLRTPAGMGQAVAVSVTLSGTAVEGTDYTIDPGTTITIPAGATEATATVHAVPGAGFAGLRSVIITLDPTPSGYTVVEDDEILLTVASPAAQVPDESEEEEEESNGAFVADVSVRSVQDGVRVAWTAPLHADIQSFLVWRGDDLVATVPYEATQSDYSYLDTEYPGGQHRYFVQFVLLGDTSQAFDADNAEASSFVTAPCGADVPDPESDFCKQFIEDDPEGEDPVTESGSDLPPAWAMVLGGFLVAALIAGVVVAVVKGRQ